MWAGPSDGLRQRTVSLAVGLAILCLASEGISGELTGGISSLGGVQMQEKQYETQAILRGGLSLFLPGRNPPLLPEYISKEL